MLTINSFVLYVEDIHISQVFYSKLFERKVTLLSPTFAAIPLTEGLTLTLKQRDNLSPYSGIRGGGTELSLSVPNRHTLERIYKRWKDLGVEFVQPPATSVYGLNFMAIDPDKHRIRVFINE